MTGHELVELLTRYGLEKELRFGCTMESGRSWSSSCNGTLEVQYGVVLEQDDEGKFHPVLDDDEEEIIDTNIVLLRIDGEEDDWQ